MILHRNHQLRLSGSKLLVKMDNELKKNNAENCS